jgi:hypothetical protein
MNRFIVKWFSKWKGSESFGAKEAFRQSINSKNKRENN